MSRRGEGGDETEAAIRALAGAVHPYLVLPGTDAVVPDFNISLLRVGIPPALYQTRLYLDAVRSVMRDPSLRAFRPDRHGRPVSLVGSLPGVDLDMSNIPGHVVGMAAFEVAVVSGVIPLEEFVGCAVRHLAILRRLAAGDEAEVPIVAALTGFEFPGGVSLAASHWTLVPMDPRIGGAASPWTLWTLPSFDVAKVMLVAAMPCRATVVQSGQEVPDSGAAPFGGFEPVISPVRLALLLACDPSISIVRPRLAQVTALLPLGVAFAYAPPGESVHFGAPRVLTDAEMQAVERFAAVLDECDTHQIRVAMTRTLSAATERSQAPDVLIDAVTARESLVGAQGETTFRVTAALAHLLERDYAQRTQRYKELKRIYRMRSEVVHGAHYAEDDARKRADAAVAIALDALRLLLTEQRWLLDLKDSQERADAILLGDPRLEEYRARNRRAQPGS